MEEKCRKNFKSHIRISRTMVLIILILFATTLLTPENASPAAGVQMHTDYWLTMVDLFFMQGGCAG